MTSGSATQSASTAILSKFLSLPQPSDRIQVTYVWNDSRSAACKSKSRVLKYVPNQASDVPIWNFGMCVMDPKPHAEDHFLRPIALYNDPFRGNDNKIVLCETLDHEGNPTAYNKRASCESAMSQVSDQHDPWFGIEQEYVLMESVLGHGSSGRRVLGWPSAGFPDPNVGYDYMYAVGADLVIGREVHEAAYRAGIYAGIDVFGDNAECMPGQWEFQIGPLPGIKCADDLWLMRYIISRVAEEFRVAVSLDPKVVPGDPWPGSGAHVNFSTKQTRDKESGMTAINRAIDRLRITHADDITAYDRNQGRDNLRRLTGGIVISSYDTFTTGIGDRTASVRVPQSVAKDGCGYLEDRRPTSDVDPYVVMERIVRSALLNE